MSVIISEHRISKQCKRFHMSELFLNKMIIKSQVNKTDFLLLKIPPLLLIQKRWIWEYNLTGHTSLQMTIIVSLYNNLYIIVTVYCWIYIFIGTYSSSYVSPISRGLDNSSIILVCCNRRLHYTYLKRHFKRKRKIYLHHCWVVKTKIPIT